MQQSLGGFVLSVQEALVRAGRAAGENAVVWRKLGTVVERCGWKNRSADRMSRLVRALADGTIFASVDLTNLNLGLDTTVHFARHPQPASGRIIKPERALGYALSQDPAAIQRALPDLGRLTHLHGGSKDERKYWLNASPVAPDLVFRIDGGGCLVCELKSEDPDRGTVNQLRLYVDAVAAAQSGPVRGLLVTARPSTGSLRIQIDQQMRELRDLYRLDWLWYDMQVALAKPDASR